MSWLDWKYLGFCCVFLQTVLSNSFCYPATYYMSKVNNRNTRRMSQTSPMSPTKIPERRQQFLQVFYCYLETDVTPCFSASISGFKHVKAVWA